MSSCSLYEFFLISPGLHFLRSEWERCVFPFRGPSKYAGFLLGKSSETWSLLGLMNWMCPCCSVVPCNMTLNEQGDPVESMHCFNSTLPTHERSQSALLYCCFTFRNTLVLSLNRFFCGKHLLGAAYLDFSTLIEDLLKKAQCILVADL